MAIFKELNLPDDISYIIGFKKLVKSTPICSRPGAPILIKFSVVEKGFSLVPTQIYLKGGMAKLELAVAKGKKLYDKRESKKQKDALLND